MFDSEGMEKTFSKMFETEEEESKVKEVMELLTSGGDNLSLKTEIPDPLRLSMWEGLRRYAENKEMTQTSSIMEGIKDSLLEFQVSKNRKSREEVIEALQSLGAMETEEKDKMKKLLERQE